MEYIHTFEKLQVLAATAKGAAVREIEERGYVLWATVCAAAQLGELDALEAANIGRAYGQLEQFCRQRRA